MKIRPFRPRTGPWPAPGWWCLWLLLGVVSGAWAWETTPASRFEAAYRSARSAYETNRDALAPAWQLGRAAYDLAEVQTRDSERARLAEEGMAACRQALVAHPASVEAQYYLALCIGQLARTKMLGALSLVSQMEATLLSARALDEHWDYAGSDRSLALLYLDAPSWPTSIGSRSKSRRHFERTVALEPAFPENRLVFAEALVRWREATAAREQLQALVAGWEAARLKWTGPDWESAWADWVRRREALERKLSPEAAESGRSVRRGDSGR